MALGAPLQLNWPLHALRQSLPGLDVRVLAEVGSTNSALLAQHRSAARDAAGLSSLWVAERQTQGRGRLGRAWQSSPGASLTFSMSAVLAPQDWSGLSLAVGVALAEALERWLQGLAGPAAAGPAIGLKWPNDLMRADPAAPLGARKLGGILIETAALVGSKPAAETGGHGPRLCVVGVGLNIQPQALQGLSSGYASLQEWAPTAQAPDALLAVAADLWAALRCFEAQGFAAFAARFAQRDILLGRAVQTMAWGDPEAGGTPRNEGSAAVGTNDDSNDNPNNNAQGSAGGANRAAGLVGWARGVDARGVMQIESDDGQWHALGSGEISLRAAGSAAALISGAHPC